MALADRIAVMDHGRLAQLATPRELYSEPANEMVASFIAQGIVLPAKVLSAEEGGKTRVEVMGQEVTVRCRPGDGPRANASICVRTPDLEIAGEGEPGIEGTVTRAVYKGGALRIDFAPAADPDRVISFEHPGHTGFEEGVRLRLRIVSGWLIPGNGPEDGQHA
jgi:iron(III) transport system ATP-binding protein